MRACVCLLALCWMSVDDVLKFYAIYGRNVSPEVIFCCLYPTLSKIYLIILYFISLSCQVERFKTYHGQVTPHGGINMSTLAKLMDCCLTAPSHYWNNVKLSSVRSCAIHLKAVTLMKVITSAHLKITHLKSKLLPKGQWVNTRNAVRFHGILSPILNDVT